MTAGTAKRPYAVVGKFFQDLTRPDGDGIEFRIVCYKDGLGRESWRVYRRTRWRWKRIGARGVLAAFEDMANDITRAFRTAAGMPHQRSRDRVLLYEFPSEEAAWKVAQASAEKILAKRRVKVSDKPLTVKGPVRRAAR